MIRPALELHNLIKHFQGMILMLPFNQTIHSEKP